MAFKEIAQELYSASAQDKPPVPENLNCDQAIDELLLRLPDFGSIFYALVNGWYIGQWADYSSCLADAADSQYVLATVKGTYNGQIEFTRGGIGKFSNGFGTRMGLCFPKQCTLDEVRYFTEDLIKGYATGVGWSDVSVEYHPASNYDQTQTSEMQNGTKAFGCIIATAFLMVATGTLIEMTTIGDIDEMKRSKNKDALYEASKFRRVEQYDSVLLQRKGTLSQTMLCFSQLRNGILLSTQYRAYKNAIKDEDSTQEDKRIAKNLKLFNGLKGMSALLVIWGITFYFSWFSIISN
jgi:hypothetical protein